MGTIIGEQSLSMCGLLLGRKTKTLIFMCGVATLGGCVASSIDTPQGFVGTLPQPTASDVLSLENTDALPEPTARPVVTVQVPSASATPPVSVANAEPAKTPEVVAEVKETNASVADAVTSRIEAAQTAPVAGSSEPTPKVEVAEAKRKPAPIVVAATSAEPKNRGLLSSLFGSNEKTKPVPKTVIAETKSKPVEQKQVVLASASATGSTAGLPGFDKSKAIGINQASDSDAAPVQVASAAGLARLTPNGLKTQHSGVSVKCFKPALVKVLKAAERKFGSPVIVTSGYRSPARNKKIRGAKNSLHIYCAAADVQIKGVSKWTLAKYFRSLPGRGGVGTYCHTKSVHVDIGPKRDWNWRCKRG